MDVLFHSNVLLFSTDPRLEDFKIIIIKMYEIWLYKIASSDKLVCVYSTFRFFSIIITNSEYPCIKYRTLNIIAWKCREKTFNWLEICAVVSSSNVLHLILRSSRIQNFDQFFFEFFKHSIELNATRIHF